MQRKGNCFDELLIIVFCPNTKSLGIGISQRISYSRDSDCEVLLRRYFLEVRYLNQPYTSYDLNWL